MPEKKAPPFAMYGVFAFIAAAGAIAAWNGITTSISSFKNKQATITASPAVSPSSAVTPQADSFRDAVNKAMQASQQTQAAKTPQQWGAVEDLWSEAIDLMRNVPKTSTNYQTAQQKIGEYQKNLAYAQKNAPGRNRATPSRPVTTASRPSPTAAPRQTESRGKTGYYLAVIDGVPEQQRVYERLLDTVDPRCNESRERIGDMVVKSVELARDGGARTSNLDMLNGLSIATEPLAGQRTDCSEMLAAMVILMEAQ